MIETLRCESEVGALEASLDLSDPALARIHYQFRNRRPQTAYVFHWLHRGYDPVEKLFRVDPNLVQIEFEGETLRIGKKVPEVPDDMEVEANMVPCMSATAENGVFAESFALELPIQEQRWYCFVREEKLDPVPTLLSAYFELGVGYFVPKVAQRVREVQTTAGPALYTHPFPASAQLLFRVGPFSKKLPVRLVKPAEEEPPPAG